jgi:hypothetical protein
MKSQKQSSNFQLDKWYLDCITDSGQTVIGYSAELEWKSFTISYASYLAFDGKQAPYSKTSLFREHPPKATIEGITWNSNGLSCGGHWKPLQAKFPTPLTLYQDKSGSVIWHCLQPLCEVDVTLDGNNYTGLGYVERLKMSIEPWHLPIKELRWGRFLSKDTCLVWIEWRGPKPLTLVYLNGIELDNVNVTDFLLSWDKGHLALCDQVVLRNGPLVKTALAKIPGVRSLFPGSVCQMKECKWRSAGELLHKGQSFKGWAIHEIVQFA